MFFNACVTPVVQFALAAFPLTKKHRDDLDILQRKMLRNIVGWRRIADEPWHDTMERMSNRLSRAQELHYISPWSLTHARAQWRYAQNVHSSPHLWSYYMRSFNRQTCALPDGVHLPHRYRGRPCTRWDDNITSFCTNTWPGVVGHWSDVFSVVDASKHEDEYILFTCYQI